MNIVSIALKELKSTIRDTRTLVFMMAFPLVLILVLGTALSGVFGSDKSISLVKISVIYKDNSNKEFSKYFDEFIKQSGKEGMKFEKADNEAEAVTEVEKRKYQAYIEINNEGVKLYENDRDSIEGSIIEGMLKGFIDKYKLVSEVVKVKPEAVATVINASNMNNYIKETSLNSKKVSSSIDYYAVSMTTMIALYGAISACFLIRGERLNKTASRLISAPLKKSEILIGKILGGIGANFLCVLLVVVVSKFAFKANWGDNLGLILLVLLTEVILAVSLGLGVSYLAKKPETPRTVVMLIIQVASFVGGAYFPIDDIDNYGGILKLLVKLSPLSWSNEAINKVIYSGNNAAIIPAVVFNMTVACLFLIIASVISGRREAL
ncbi:ABC transporter permease [Clostridium zeae]|uniref:ABC transporter permease n=1 Tax=Clostridium zeae TaxID=2759022 RepID=A0ABQ1EE08_9CLOT|nr:ABC transporter permease [Clostridium zeae]GFZ32996.1 ABC transporter permease [Clostridium zeae]